MSREQVDWLLACFVAGTPARPAAEIAGVNRNTASHYYHRLREIIARHLPAPEVQGTEFQGIERDSEASEPSQDAASIAGLAPLFGLLEQAGHIRVLEIAVETAAPVSVPVAPHGLDALVCKKESANSVDQLATAGRRLQIVLGGGILRDRRKQRLIRQFWNSAMRHLRRFNGVPTQHLYLYLKECEWRFNNGPAEQLLHTLRSWVLEST